jgi:predicted DNA-binding transcriptional regulator AlpA
MSTEIESVLIPGACCVVAWWKLGISHRQPMVRNMEGQANQKRKLIKRKEVEARTGLSRWSIARLEKANKFPRHVQLLPTQFHWFEDEIDAHLEQLAAQRDSVAA